MARKTGGNLFFWVDWKVFTYMVVALGPAYFTEINLLSVWELVYMIAYIHTIVVYIFL